MEIAFSRSFTTRSESETSRLAADLAPKLCPGDAILLKGGLGAGKTHFARALIQARLGAAGRYEDVPSPSYTLVQTYSDGQVEIWHCDLYRLGHADELLELGLEDAFEDAICLIEWPERLEHLSPSGALVVELAVGEKEGEREVTVQSSDPRWQAMFETVRLEDVDA
ncbi:MAG: tRNA (adenosine(37)-N6)-threonylcarbamoyltransferase complex ATPase subunit type 1 TsaE [Rhodobacter sp.]|nr:tRNA (adenosine(37)-N6)-threonylcarbamoyltransferase complex ATPase subunit type 1 TsaE [Rhodobacter sp.]